MKTLEEIKEILAKHKEELRRKYKVKEIGIFGSYVRGEYKRKSDLDILVEFEEPVSLLMLVRVENYLSEDILDNMERAEKFIGEISYEGFVRDEKTNFAVIRCIEIIGEAAKHVCEEIWKRYPEIPWKDMAGMRDKVIHFYFGVNLQKAWKVVKEDIPMLKPLIKKVLDDLESEK